MINMKDQTIGIEIETVGLSRFQAAQAIKAITGQLILKDGRNYTVNDYQGRTWKCTFDSSLRSINGNSCEIVSPILNYSDIKLISEIVESLKSYGASVNDSCGVHIHIGAQDITGIELANLVKVIDKQENYLFAAFNTEDRRMNHYCKPVERSLMEDLNAALKANKNLSYEKMADVWYNRYENEDRDHHYHTSRYHGLNLHATFQKGTIEYRYFNGTLDSSRITSYIQLVMAITAYARNSKGAHMGRRLIGDGSSKYALRVFLNTIGLIGDEFKTLRAHMRENLVGDTAFKDDRRIRYAA